MTDVVSPEVRSRMMSSIRGYDTKPELYLRKNLHARGFRFRLHDRKLPGCPDLIFRSHNAVLFAHGCFWHGHDCVLFRWPKSRAEWWREKLLRNRTNDARAEMRLSEAGWRVGVVWECALKGPGQLPSGIVLNKCERWLRSSRPRLEIRGTK